MRRILLALVLLIAVGSPIHAQRGRAVRLPPPPPFKIHPVEPRHEPNGGRPFEPAPREHVAGNRESDSRSAEQTFHPKEFLELRSKAIERLVPSEREHWNELSREHIEFVPGPQFDAVDAGLLASANARPKFVVLLPKNAEYESVFGRTYTAKSESEMEAAFAAFSNLSRSDVQILHTFTRAALIEVIRSSPNQPVVVIGHSESGHQSREIKLSDGSTINVREIHKAGVDVRSPCIIVTCHGKDVGVDREISITEALNMCSVAVKAINSGRAKTAADVVAEMRVEANSWSKSAVTIAILATVGGEVVLIVFTYDIEDGWTRYVWLATGTIGGCAIIYVVYRKSRRPLAVAGPAASIPPQHPGQMPNPDQTRVDFIADQIGNIRRV